jgi:hypothetical protein
LTATSTRTVPWSDLSTRVEASWTFSSARVPGEAPAPLPLMAVRFTAPVDLANQAAGGRPAVVPVTVQRMAGAAPARIRRLTVEASYDDGRTWRPAAVGGHGASRLVVLWHPELAATTGFVSLRATATDTAGNTVEETLVRAYQLRGPDADR